MLDLRYHVKSNGKPPIRALLAGFVGKFLLFGAAIDAAAPIPAPEPMPLVKLVWAIAFVFNRPGGTGAAHPVDLAAQWAWHLNSNRKTGFAPCRPRLKG